MRADKPAAYVTRAWIAQVNPDIKNWDLTRWVQNGKVEAVKVEGHYLYNQVDVSTAWHERIQRFKLKKAEQK